MNPNFVFREIRRYNQAQSQKSKDAALVAIGLHAEILEKKDIALRDLLPEERNRIIYFLKQFLQQQGLEVALK